MQNKVNHILINKLTNKLRRTMKKFLITCIFALAVLSLVMPFMLAIWGALFIACVVFLYS